MRATQSTTPLLKTRRLLLRPLELADASQIQLVFPQWEIVRYLSNRVPWPYPCDGALAFIRDDALAAAARGEAWNWTLRLKSNPAHIIGGIELRKNERDNRGFWLDPEFHRQGYMTEAAASVTEFWFDVLQFSVLRTSKAVANVASCRISEEQGMRIIGRVEREYISGRQPAEIWEITASEWRARQLAKRDPAM
ncbi:MAG: GNAT family N-acetyltransferase [Acidobacteriota bacterium]|nr:GNAT family N-acetyltransferase [Acidobacteriota bacterium]